MAGRKRTTRNANSSPKKRKKATKKASSKKAEPKKAQKRKRLPKGLLGESGEESLEALLVFEHSLGERTSEESISTMVSSNLLDEVENGASAKHEGEIEPLTKKESASLAKGLNGGAERSKIIVREMEIDDIASVFHLGERLFTSESYPILYRTWDAYEVTGLFHSDSDYCLVAESHENELLGFVMGTTIDKGTAWTYGYVTWLGVAPGWQRAGVGQQLMDAIEDRMLETEDVRMFIVDTSAHNHRGIRFFQKLGFEQMQKHVYLWKTLKGDAEARVRSVKRRRRARRQVNEREEQKKG